MTDNCWCTDVESNIENKLKDGYDDVNLGLFNYSIYDTTCSSIIDEIIKDPSLSVEDFIDILEKTVVYPNPVSSEINIQMRRNVEELTIELFDVTGRLVIRNNYRNVDLIKVQLQSLNSGNYILNIISKGNKIVKKIIKK